MTAASPELAVITALVDVIDQDRRRPPWSVLVSAAAGLGLTVTSSRGLAPDVYEVEVELPDDDPRPPRARARQLRGDLGAALAERRPGTAFDLAVQIARPAPRAPRLVVMDMDSTVVAIEVIDELARRHGVGAEVAAITARAMAGELDFEASLRARVARLAGLPVAALAEVAAALPFTAGVARLVTAIQALGGWTAIVSGGFDFAVDAAAAHLRVDHVRANQLGVARGRLTGELDGPIVTGLTKADLVTELASLHELDLARTIAIGDGANDLPMLDRAGLGVAFHGKPRVAAAADTAITRGGLDRVLYLLGLSDDDQAELA